MRKSVVHWWNLHDVMPMWHCRRGAPVQGEEHRQTTNLKRVTCVLCRRAARKPRAS